jgi:hypothetical protein
MRLTHLPRGCTRSLQLLDSRAFVPARQTPWKLYDDALRPAATRAFSMAGAVQNIFHAGERIAPVLLKKAWTCFD